MMKKLPLTTRQEEQIDQDLESLADILVELYFEDKAKKNIKNNSP